MKSSEKLRRNLSFSELSGDRLGSDTFEQDNKPALAEIERLIQEDRYSEVIARLGTYCNRDLSNLELTLHHLFALVKVDSFTAHEQQIEQFIIAENLSDKEKEILRRIIGVGHEEAERENRQDRAMVYQRLARCLVLGQPLAEVWHSREPRYTATETQETSLPGVEKPAGQKPSEPAFVFFRDSRNLARQNRKQLASVLGVLAMISISIVLMRPIPSHEPQVLTEKTEEIGVIKQADLKLVPEAVPEDPVARELRVKEVQNRVKIRVDIPLREEPRFGATSVEMIEKGSIVGVLDSHGNWLKVRTEADSSVGYVRKEFAVELEQ
jgi:hypothetical protein